MKQRVRVVGIIKKEGEILLLRRKAGRSNMPVFWELPTGKIKFGEQPEEAMSRVMFEDLGMQVKGIKLRDVVTFLAFSGSSQMANLYIVYEIVVQASNKIVLGERYSVYKYLSKNEFHKLQLDDGTNVVLDIENERGAKSDFSNYRDTANGATVYVDGSSRGNPGPAGIGYYIVNTDGTVIKQGGEFIGFATSRVAEFYALKEGIEQAVELGLRDVRFVGDNLMMINQMNGIYKLKNQDLIPIYGDIKKMVETNFDSVAFIHVKREKNEVADREANLAIDRHFDGGVIK